MKRRSKPMNEADRAALERQAMSELQSQSGPPSARSKAGGRGTPAWGAGTGGPAAPAWGASVPPMAHSEPAPEPAWKSRLPGPVADPEPEETSEDLDPLDEELLDEEEEEAWEDDGDWTDEDDPGFQVGSNGLLGIPLDYDATGIALQQLADRSNISRPASYVTAIDSGEAERIRDKAMAQFLERQKIRSRQDAELAALRAAAAPTAAAAPKRAPFPPLSPGLSAKSLVMQPVMAPPLNVPKARRASKPAPIDAVAVPKKAVPKKAVPKKAAAKKAAAKKVAPAKALAPRKVAAVPKKVAAVAPEKVAPVKAGASTRAAASTRGTRVRAAPVKVVVAKPAVPDNVVAPAATPTPKTVPKAVRPARTGTRGTRGRPSS